jgi:RNA polymerase sigma-70 factor (family 1)
MESKAPRDEEVLLAAIARGDHHAFRKLFDRYHHKVYSYSIRFLRSEVLAEEIVQEVFINIWLGRTKITQINNFGGYLRVITKNLTLNTLKKIALDFKLSNAQINNWTEVDNDTEHNIQLKETRALLSEAILKLPKQQRLIYQMCHIDGLKQKEAAEQLNISPLTVKAHLRDATKTIRNIMGDRAELSVLFFMFFYLIK